MLSSPLPRGISANSMCWSTMRASSPTIFVAVAVALLQRIGAVGAFGAHGEFDRQRTLFAEAQRLRAARLVAQAAVAECFRVVLGQVACIVRPNASLSDTADRVSRAWSSTRKSHGYKM
jgi:hypothetical protein